MKAFQRYIPHISVLAFLLVAYGSCNISAQSGASSPPAQKGVQKGTEVSGDDGAPGGTGVSPKITDEATSNPVVGSNKDRKIPDGCWFEPIHLDFGTFVESSKRLLKGIYKFENKTKDPQKIMNITATCKCQALDLFVDGKRVVLERKNDPSRALKNEILVPAGAKGWVELTFDVANVTGTRTGELRFDTSDPAMPSFVVTCEATITPAFTVIPGTVHLGIMSPKEKKEWTVMVRSFYYKDSAWKITKADAVMPKGMTVTSFARKKDKDGVYWEVKGSYGPKLEEGSTGGSVVLHSNHEEHKILVQVNAEVKQKSDLTRKILEFKPFDRNESQEKTVYVWPTHESIKLTIDRVEITKSRVGKQYYTIKIIKPGENPEGMKNMPLMIELPKDKVWQIVIKTKPGIPGRIMRAHFLVHFKEKGLMPKRFRCIGFPKTR